MSGLAGPRASLRDRKFDHVGASVPNRPTAPQRTLKQAGDASTMLGNLAPLAGLVSPKLFLIVLAVLAGLAFLLLLGALALGSALALIALISWILRAPVRVRRRFRRRRPGPSRARAGLP